MIKGIHHISIIVSSDESVAFYRSLGFDITKKIDRDYDSVVLMEGYGIKLELFIDPKHPQRAENPENLGLRHLSLQVDNLDSVLDRFECGKVMKDWFGYRYCITNDPDGLPIVFYEL